MASLKDIRKRIGSVKNTQKITRAMKLVAAARLRKAQEAITAARPYSEALSRVVGDLAEHAGRDAHPLLAEKTGDRILLVVMTSDKGLAGGFNAQINRRVAELLKEDWKDKDVKLRIVGRKGNDYSKRRFVENILDFRLAPTGETALEFSRELTNEIVDEFLEDKVDRVVVLYNEFVSAMTQNVTLMQVLPVEPAVREESEGEEHAGAGDFVYEPSKQDLLDHLVPLAVQNSIFKSGLESIASELGSRMSAMDSATNNAGEMIDKLTLTYNRARQAAITTELTEIVSGAESLKG
ncbi:MAG: ATP synthase F1 subunit gamma [Myxococcales bacterium]|nr:ATP synthase F1 subunit gamma [Myxococcales bacterium]